MCRRQSDLHGIHFAMRRWQITIPIPEGDRRAFLSALRTRAGVFRGVDERSVVVEVEGPDEEAVRRDWSADGVRSVWRVGDGWDGDWWDGLAETRPHGEYVVDKEDRLFAVPFHHVDVDASGRRLTLFWNGLAAYEPGPASAEEREDGVIVTVTERRGGGGNAVPLAGEGHRSTVTLSAPLGDRPVWDRYPGAARPRY